MNKLEECARALCILDGIDPDDCWAANDLPGEIAIPAWRQARYIDRTRAVIRCLMELKDRDVCACPKEPTHNNLEYYRSMLQSVLDGKE